MTDHPEPLDKPSPRTDDRARLQAIVYGHVQGVFFRAHTQRRALGLNLQGYVCNRDDGTVEVVAEGERAALRRLLAWLHQGPPQASVQEVTAAWLPPSGEFVSFEVRH